jgi:hypothetical protein
MGVSARTLFHRVEAVRLMALCPDDAAGGMKNAEVRCVLVRSLDFVKIAIILF